MNRLKTIGLLVLIIVVIGLIAVATRTDPASGPGAAAPPTAAPDTAAHLAPDTADSAGSADSVEAADSAPVE